MMKRKLIIDEWLSLDGCVADKTGGLDFFAKHVRESYTSQSRIDFLNSIDTILFGRKTYDQFSALWPKRSIENDLLAEKMNTLEKIVFSGSLKDAPWGAWPNAALEAGEPASKVKALKSLAGKDLVVWGSVTLAQALMKEDLVDEYHLHICPVLTGGGRKLFTDELKPASLLLLETKHDTNGVVFLRYGIA